MSLEDFKTVKLSDLKPIAYPIEMLEEMEKEVIERLTRIETIVEERFDSLEKRLPICIGATNSKEIAVLNSKIKLNSKLIWSVFAITLGALAKTFVALS